MSVKGTDGYYLPIRIYAQGCVRKLAALLHAPRAASRGKSLPYSIAQGCVRKLAALLYVLAVCSIKWYSHYKKGNRMEQKLRVGVIATTHGVRGEVKVFPTTDDARRFSKLKEIILDTGKDELILEIENVKFFKQFAILKFKGIDTINDVEKYKGKELYVLRENAQKLGHNEYFIADLIGLKVKEEGGRELGILKDVLETGANDVYIVEMEDKKELLIPAIKQCILKVDLEAGEMEVHLLEGLL